MRTPADWMIVVPAAAAVVLLPWTAGIATQLPHTELAHHWNAAWAGLDAAIMTGLALTSWLGKRRSHQVGLAAAATTTLLCTDAWFDLCTTASGSALGAAIAEACLELVIAVVCLLIGARVTGELRRTELR